MSTTGTVTHYTGWGCQYPNPRKYTILNGNSVFNLHDLNLHDIFRECNPGVKRDLPVPDYLSNNATNQLFVQGESYDFTSLWIPTINSTNRIQNHEVFHIQFFVFIHSTSVILLHIPASVMQAHHTLFKSCLSLKQWIFTPSRLKWCVSRVFNLMPDKVQIQQRISTPCRQKRILAYAYNISTHKEVKQWCVMF